MDAPGKTEDVGDVGAADPKESMATAGAEEATSQDLAEVRQEELPTTECAALGGSQDLKKEPPLVPSVPPVSSPQSQTQMENRNLVNSTIVPTLDDSAGEPIVVGLPDLLPVSQGSEQRSSTVGSTCEVVEPRSPELLGTENEDVNKDSKCQVDTSGANGESGKEESVLPSMGILPDVEEMPPQATSSQQQEASPPSGTQSSENRSPEPHPLDPSEVVHKIKKIKWQDIEVPIITQNNNGPCPLLAIVNVMLLKGQITLPTDRTEITGGELVLMVGNALFDLPRNSLPLEMRRHLEQNTEDAISILHKLLTGLDVNIKFSGVRDFEFTGELCVFDLLGIMLYHGWVVDPSSEVSPVITDLSYNQLTNNIFAWREEAVKNNNNDLLVKAMLCEEFMANSGSQLTIHGLFELGSALQREEIAVLFRNNHFSTIYKRGDQLYQLLTDQGFLHENVVWETLNDVDATFSEFVNGNFQPIPPVPESTPSSEAAQNMTMQQQINSDEEMAQKLQEEENRLAAEAEAEAGATRYPAAPPPQTRQAPQPPPQVQEEKRKKDCIIL
ncbi:ubiquitin carboxyl-terminal hydrolase MINDY-1-like isoform X3 [Penaeus japonicus]|uniref:ubiquitin carboxyl-terminal hydrolase MINDY-1-like isoform X3 n=1 Tax=Penaeus japonicus TaxID=27405 RepID=UPI001C716622|nr:ubiquitin carboxyl-terminal hydrolase MINDY-1-like isoform X3 [Penaeus japonicus]